ncbi:MAG: SusC/RagA family TonB-linked outer membrane protein, partial [Bacteroidota bacterium]
QVNQWTPQNETDIPATVQFYNSSRYIEKGDFIRLTNVNLGYNFGNIAGTDMNLKVYASGQNLLLITDYSGYDPELSSRKGNQGIEDVAPGINIGAYPNPRTFTFGLKLGF